MASGPPKNTDNKCDFISFFSPPQAMSTIAPCWLGALIGVFAKFQHIFSKFLQMGILFFKNQAVKTYIIYIYIYIKWRYVYDGFKLLTFWGLEQECKTAYTRSSKHTEISTFTKINTRMTFKRLSIDLAHSFSTCLIRLRSTVCVCVSV